MSAPRLPAQGRPAERGDAARNREAVMAAALELAEQAGAHRVTMDAVAEAAGVGKGTVFRRFESREGLMRELLRCSERQWMDRQFVEPADGSPLERLRSFGAAWAEFLVDQRLLVQAAGPSGVRRHLRASAPRVYVDRLLDQLGRAGDTDYLAFVLLASLELPILSRLDESGLMTRDCAEAGWDRLVRELATPRSQPGRARCLPTG